MFSFTEFYSQENKHLYINADLLLTQRKAKITQKKLSGVWRTSLGVRGHRPALLLLHHVHNALRQPLNIAVRVWLSGQSPDEFSHTFRLQQAAVMWCYRVEGGEMREKWRPRATETTSSLSFQHTRKPMYMFNPIFAAIFVVNTTNDLAQNNLRSLSFFV